MFSKYHSQKSLAIALVLTSLSGSLTVAARTAISDGAVVTRESGPVSLIQGSDLDDATKATLVQLIEAAAASTDDREQFIAATEAIAQGLVDAGASFDFVEQFAQSYGSEFVAETKFEWDIDPSIGECNAQFECSWALGVCVVITWHDGNGGGGINCISKSR